MKQNNVKIIIGLGFAMTLAQPLCSMSNHRGFLDVPTLHYQHQKTAPTLCMNDKPSNGGQGVVVTDQRKQPQHEHHVRRSQHNPRVHQPEQSAGSTSQQFVCKHVDRVVRPERDWASYLMDADTDSIHMLIKKVTKLQCKRYRAQLLALLHQELAQREGGVAGLHKTYRKNVNRFFGNRGSQMPGGHVAANYEEFQDERDAANDVRYDRYEEQESHEQWERKLDRDAELAELEGDLLQLREDYLLSLEDPAVFDAWQTFLSEDAEWNSWALENHEVVDLFNDFIQAAGSGYSVLPDDPDMLYKLVDLFEWINENIMSSDEDEEEAADE